MGERQRIVIRCSYGDLILNVPAGIRVTQVVAAVATWCGSMIAAIGGELDAIAEIDARKEEE